jgi:hypothetical protein
VGVLDRFEKGIERAVNGVFARAFRSEVQPVELASALKREADEHASVVGRNRTIAPNEYVIELGPADHRRLAQWEDALGDELATVLNDHALQQRYAFVGPVHVRFEHADDLDTGVFRVRSTTARDSDHAGQGRPAPHHDPDGPGAFAGPPGYPQPGYAQPGYAEPGYPQPGYGYPPPASPAPSAPAYPPAAGSPQAGFPARSGPAVDPGHGEAHRPPAPVIELDGRPIPLTRAVTVIGRSGDVDIPLDDAGVSRRHAEIQVVEGRARVVDLGSTNGTFVDGERVAAADLHDGSTITVGRSRLTFRLGQR